MNAVRPLFQTLSYILGTSVFDKVSIVKEFSLAWYTFPRPRSIHSAIVVLAVTMEPYPPQMETDVKKYYESLAE